jgi:hypothetical protein
VYLIWIISSISSRYEFCNWYTKHDYIHHSFGFQFCIQDIALFLDFSYVFGHYPYLSINHKYNLDGIDRILSTIFYHMLHNLFLLPILLRFLRIYSSNVYIVKTFLYFSRCILLFLCRRFFRIITKWSVFWRRSCWLVCCSLRLGIGLFVDRGYF